MPFKTKKRELSNFETPQEMYADYKNRTINGLIDYQSDVIDNYMKHGYAESDIALELPTGSGKTLIGLVIGEFRRRKNGEKVIYLCPTKQLVNQVVEQAKLKYGIKTHAFLGRQADYDPIKYSDYIMGKMIAVTTYSALFNNNSAFNNADIIILDDAHSSENYIVSNWSLEIHRYEHKQLYNSLVENLKDIIGISNYNRMTSDYSIPDEAYWCEKVPNIKIWDHMEELKTIIDVNVENTKLKYAWTNIRSKMQACNIFINWNTILIRPYIPPTMTNDGFKDAKQRIYMSATLGVSGELERITGVSRITRLSMVNGWDKKGLGRRFFIFPRLSLTSEDTLDLLIKMTEVVDRGLMLVQDSNVISEIKDFYEKKANCKVFLSTDIEKSKKTFVESKKSIAILANRYDGIDLAKDDCRLLIIYNLPKVTHLQERFITTRMAASVLFNERVKTRLIQAVGRCTRSPIDYSAVCIIGTDVVNDLLSKNKIKDFHPELRAELEFGYSQYDIYKTPDDIIVNLKEFLNHSSEWDGAEEEIIELRDEIIDNNKGTTNSKVFDSLLKSASYEVKYQYAIWREDYENALSNIEKILGILVESELKGYRGFWNYLAGCVAYKLFKNGQKSYEAIAKKYMNRAAACTDSITWFNKLIIDTEFDDTQTNDYLVDVIDRIENEILKDGTNSNAKFERRVANILSLLNNSNGEKFEEGHELLGKLLGYISQNTDADSGPDPWWIINDKLCIVSEDKMYESDDKAITTKHVRQASSHNVWIRKEIKILDPDAKIITIFITNSKNIERSAATFASNIYYVNKENFVQWATKAIEGIRRIRRMFNGEGDLVWRSEAMTILKELQLTPLDYLNFIQSKELNMLKTN
ncbi:DEAD/DEAH box helicase [Clostridium sporogenes]|uniref:DEAD/DEAH box helicase n=1 Tax=Clostridium sporogenes TaxID=1509 RepID=A0AAE6LZD5_CLOSG|nr:DEAD/DEAH box helicase [Clostridium sporogenes]QDY34578.1 DEAD/DEAH box helicase [Clostridium sporogenes]